MLALTFGVNVLQCDMKTFIQHLERRISWLISGSRVPFGMITEKRYSPLLHYSAKISATQYTIDVCVCVSLTLLLVLVPSFSCASVLLNLLQKACLLSHCWPCAGSFCWSTCQSRLAST